MNCMLVFWQPSLLGLPYLLRIFIVFIAFAVNSFTRLGLGPSASLFLSVQSVQSLWVGEGSTLFQAGTGSRHLFHSTFHPARLAIYY